MTCQTLSVYKDSWHFTLHGHMNNNPKVKGSLTMHVDKILMQKFLY
jgi:hypothetical protein